MQLLSTCDSTKPGNLTARLLFRKQVHYQFVSASYMGVHTGYNHWRMLTKINAQKAWRTVNKQVTAREVCSQAQGSFVPSVVGQCFFLPGRQLPETFLEKHPDKEHLAVQHWLATSAWGRRIPGVRVLWKPQSEGWAGEGLRKPVCQNPLNRGT